MSGRKNAPRRKAEKERQKEEAGRVIVTTSRGVSGECMPIGNTLQQLDENIRGSIEWPEPPTYTVTYAGGETKEIPHDAESIKDPKTTDEERAAWDEYLEKQAQAQVEYGAKSSQAQMRLIATEGFIPIDATDEDEWIQQHEWIGYVVPEDPLERQLHYFLTEVIGSVDDDMMTIYKGIYRATGIDEEVLSKLEASFRVQMEQSKGADAGAGEGDSGSKQETGVVDEQHAPGGEGESGEESDA